MITITENSNEETIYFGYFKDGSEKGLNYLYKVYYDRLFFYALKRCNDTFLSQTVVQDGFLKVWYSRERIENLFHFLCFIRLNIRWQLQAHYRSQQSRFHLQMSALYSSGGISFSSLFEDQGDDIEQSTIDEEKLKLIHDAIKYLPAEKQNVLKILLACGSYKEVARRYGRRNIHSLVNESVGYLKSLLNSSALTIVKPKDLTIEFEGFLDEQQRQVYGMRKKQGLGFGAISEILNLRMEDVINIYSYTLSIIKQKKGYGQRKNYSYSKDTVNY